MIARQSIRFGTGVLIPMRRRAVCLAGALASWAGLFAGAAAAQDEADTRAVRLQAGAARSNITPWLDTSINGGMSDRTARHVHDELNARCLVLDDGETQLAIAIGDSCMIPREVVHEAKRQIEEAVGIPPSHVLIAATHSHSCPTATPVFQSETVEGYPEFLARRIADGVRRAWNNRAPAEVGWISFGNKDHVFNRRWFMKPGTAPPGPFPDGPEDRVKMNPPAASPDLVEPAGPIDPEVVMLCVRAAEENGRPIAAVANYALHYVGGTGPGHLSADYFGVFARGLERRLQGTRLDPPFVAMMSNGTSGDINNINFRKPRQRRGPYEQMRIVGEDLAERAASHWPNARFRSDVTLAAVAEDLGLGVRLPSEAEVEEARRILEAAKGRPLRGLREVYARETVLLASYPERVPVTVQALRIGDLGIAAIPCEVFVELGLEIKRRAPFASAFTIELANGYNGYLPTERHHELGGYETWRARSSYLEIDAAEQILDTVLQQFEELTGGQEH